MSWSRWPERNLPAARVCRTLRRLGAARCTGDPDSSSSEASSSEASSSSAEDSSFLLRRVRAFFGAGRLRLGGGAAARLSPEEELLVAWTAWGLRRLRGTSSSSSSSSSPLLLPLSEAARRPLARLARFAVSRPRASCRAALFRWPVGFRPLAERKADDDAWRRVLGLVSSSSLLLSARPRSALVSRGMLLRT